jgi:hypothetical protein
MSGSPATNPVSPSASTAAASPPAATVPPGHVSVMCPAGFNATSMKGVDPKKALYARVTYRPH